MNLATENILLVGSILLFISLLAGKTFYKFGVPVLLLFTAIGILAAPKELEEYISITQKPHNL